MTATMLMQPSSADVRRFFCQVYAKWQTRQPLDAMQALAAPWVAEHPEYHAELADEAAALGRDYSVESERSNPFLHLAMHLSISEQISIDQPRGIRQAVQLLSQRRPSLHAAHHEVMEELGAMLWQAQRLQRAPDGQDYVARVQRRATRD